MNREIKFRVVWNKQVSLDAYTIGEFIDGVELDFKDGGTLPMTDIDWGEDKVEYLQYTGLKDKNGKEIYEGDVLEFEYEDEFWGSKPHKVRRTVKWETYYGAGWYFGKSYKDGEKRWSYPKPPEDAEVIGNIYENPELLEKTND